MGIAARRRDHLTFGENRKQCDATEGSHPLVARPEPSETEVVGEEGRVEMGGEIDCRNQDFI